MIVAFILFSLAVFFVFYLPGHWVIRVLHIKSINHVSAITLSLATGIAMFLLGCYILAWVNLSFVYLLLILPVVLFECFRLLKNPHTQLPLSQLLSWEALIILIGVLVMVSTTVTSGIEKSGSLVFYGINGADGIFHSALIGNLRFQFPPSFPGLSHTMLRGYHILYDFMLSRFGVFFGFSTFDLYFRFFSIFTALFYGLSGITLAYAIKMDSLTRKVFLFILYFAQGGEYLLFHWFENGNTIYNSGIVEPAGNIADPSVLFSIAIVFVLFTVLFSPLKKSQYFVPMLLLGVLPGIKVYTAILTYAGVAGVAAFQAIKRRYNMVFILIIAGLISASIYLPFNLGAGSLVWDPFLFFRHFMESDLFFTTYQWALKMQVYELHHNIPRIIYLYVLALLAFFVPPLGVRLVLFLKIGKLFNKHFYTSQHIFWIAFSVVGLLIPVLFIQSIGVFNTIQFYWLLWIILLIPTAFTLTALLGRVSYVKVIFLFSFLCIISLSVLLLPLRTNDKKNPLVISPGLVFITHYIQQNVAAKDDIMVANGSYTKGIFQESYAIPLIGTLVGKPMFYEREAADFSQTRGIEEGRQSIIDRVVTELEACPPTANEDLKNIMHTIHVSYVLLLKDTSCMNTLPSFTKVIKKGKYSLYKLL